jgi:hypothetical protein
MDCRIEMIEAETTEPYAWSSKGRRRAPPRPTKLEVARQRDEAYLEGPRGSRWKFSMTAEVIPARTRRREEGGVNMRRLRRVMALWGRTSIPFFKSS